MKIAIVGYGRMGKSIEKIAIKRGHKIVSKLEESPNSKNLYDAEIAIEFTFPSVAYQNIISCINLGIPVVSGTTGWTEKLNEVKNFCLKKNGAFIYGSNFSLGVNLFFEINKKILQLMKNYSNYSIKIDEVHHIDKKDTPSGTAISLAQDIIKDYPSYKSWVLGDQSSNKEELKIFSKRIKDVFGIHSITFSSKEDSIKVEHCAFTRDSFALGAVIAAEFLINKRGVFTMKDVLNI